MGLAERIVGRGEELLPRGFFKWVGALRVREVKLDQAPVNVYF